MSISGKPSAAAACEARGRGGGRVVNTRKWQDIGDSAVKQHSARRANSSAAQHKKRRTSNPRHATHTRGWKAKREKCGLEKALHSHVQGQRAPHAWKGSIVRRIATRVCDVADDGVGRRAEPLFPRRRQRTGVTVRWVGAAAARRRSFFVRQTGSGGTFARGRGLCVASSLS